VRQKAGRNGGGTTLAGQGGRPGPDAINGPRGLLQFRRANEQSHIGNGNHAAWVEDASWKFGNETRQMPEVYP